MTQWTESAKARLEEYLARMRQPVAASGADVNEVAEDLRRHVAEEVAARKLAIVTEQDVAQILARIGAPEAAVEPEQPPPPSTPATSRPKRGWWRKLGLGVLLLIGVILPLGTVVFEFLTGACAGVLFDPIPTLAHAVLVTLVPLVNLAVWIAVCRRDPRWRAALGWASGVAIGIALVYALLFLPVTPFAVIGIIFLGFGLVPLSPLLSFVCALVLRRLLRGPREEGGRLPGLWLGLTAGVAAVVVFTLPMVIANIGLQMAASDSPERSMRGVRLLRDWGQHEELLRACYGRTGRGGLLYSWISYIPPESARNLYYRVTGHPFNSVPPPKLYAGRGRWSLMEDEFTWDEDQAGDAVAGRVRGLSLANSRQDGVVYPEPGLAYVEWTLEFKNESRRQQEARAQIDLPPGAVVSRLTLWIDGEERPAAFGGRSQVKTAYKAVVTQRRDPVLVTTCGPDRVLLQCFPVPPNGGRMKLRLGITAPLALTSADTGCLRWPRFAERNFTLAEQFRHSLWVESSQPLETAGGKLTTDSGKPGLHVLRGQVQDAELAAPANTLCAQRPAEVTRAWTSETREDAGTTIRQFIREQHVPPPDRVILVVDATAGMDAFYRQISTAAASLPPDIAFAILLARDGCEDVIPLQKGTTNLYGKIALWKFHGAGGQDNVPALIRAWELAAQGKAGVIVWVHGPQPILLDATEELRQRFERTANGPLLLEMQTQPGPNRVVEKLDGLKPVRSALRLGDLGDDLGRLFKAWSAPAGTLEYVREKVGADAASPPPQGAETSMHLARLWAAEEVARLCDARETDKAAQLARRYQLVTPVSGAVVLETTAQYEQAGLQPAPAQSIPAVPEPSTYALVLLGLTLAAAARRIRKHKTHGRTGAA